MVTVKENKVSNVIYGENNSIKQIKSPYFSVPGFKYKNIGNSYERKRRIELGASFNNLVTSLIYADINRTDSAYYKVEKAFRELLSKCKTNEDIENLKKSLEAMADMGGYAHEFYIEHKYILDHINYSDQNKINDYTIDNSPDKKTNNPIEKNILPLQINYKVINQQTKPRTTNIKEADLNNIKNNIIIININTTLSVENTGKLTASDTLENNVKESQSSNNPTIQLKTSNESIKSTNFNELINEVVYGESKSKETGYENIKTQSNNIQTTINNNSNTQETHITPTKDDEEKVNTTSPENIQNDVMDNNQAEINSSINEHIQNTHDTPTKINEEKINTPSPENIQNAVMDNNQAEINSSINEHIQNTHDTPTKINEEKIDTPSPENIQNAVMDNNQAEINSSINEHIQNTPDTPTKINEEKIDTPLPENIQNDTIIENNNDVNNKPVSTITYDEVTGKIKQIKSEYFNTPPFEYNNKNVSEEENLRRFYLNISFSSLVSALALADGRRTETSYQSTNDSFAIIVGKCKNDEDLNNVKSSLQYMANLGGYAKDFLDSKQETLKDLQTARIYASKNRPRKYKPAVKRNEKGNVIHCDYSYAPGKINSKYNLNRNNNNKLQNDILHIVMTFALAETGKTYVTPTISKIAEKYKDSKELDIIADLIKEMASYGGYARDYVENIDDELLLMDENLAKKFIQKIKNNSEEFNNNYEEQNQQQPKNNEKEKVEENNNKKILDDFRKKLDILIMEYDDYFSNSVISIERCEKIINYCNYLLSFLNYNSTKLGYDVNEFNNKLYKMKDRLNESLERMKKENYMLWEI